MSTKTASMRNWIAIIVILVIFAVVAAIWPSLPIPTLELGGGGGSTTRIPSEVEEIEVPELLLPITQGIGLPDTVNAFVIIGILAGLVIVPVVVVGGGIAFIYTLLSRITASVTEDPEFKKTQAALEKREQERIKQMRAGRDAGKMPEHKMPRWSVISNTLIALMFISFFALMLGGTFYPEGLEAITNPFTQEKQLVGMGGLLALILSVVALPFLLWRIRPRRLESVNGTDYGAIPWDTIIVIVTGLLVVGLGIGYIVYLNVPVH